MAFTRNPGAAGIILTIFSLLLCSTLTALPVSAATQYLGDGPSFSAMVTGTNEFVPGEDTTISILVKNTGLNSMKQVGVGTIEPEDKQNTAKSVTVGLASAGDAVIVRSDPRKIGDLPGGSTATVAFNVKISANATAGEYQLPLRLQYRYPRVIVQPQADVFEFTYNDGDTTVPVTIRIQSRVKPEVVEAVPEQLTPGSEGYLNLKIKNAGPENGTMASVKLIRSGTSPIIPTAATVYVGDFPSGSTVSCRYKVSVSQDATGQTYPVDLAVTYTNREGSIATSSLTTAGVPVEAKPAFSVVSPVPELAGGSGRTIEVMYRNGGNTTIYAAQARITPHDPVTAGDNSAYLGDIAPGGSAAARFELQAAAGAQGTYAFDSTLRYRDVSGTSLESDIIPVRVTIVPAPGFAFPGGMTGVAAIIAVIVIAIGILVYRQKRKHT